MRISIKNGEILQLDTWVGSRKYFCTPYNTYFSMLTNTKLKAAYSALRIVSPT
jgi:hypothetical protein